jgi:hypothetical protein
LDRLYERAFETVGISQSAAQSTKPAGLESGEALNAYADIQTQRFKPCYELYQRFFLRAGRQVLTLARDIAEKHPNYEVKAVGKASMSTIKAADVLLEDNEFSLELYPTNAFADDPAARLQQVQTLLGAGLLDPSSAKRLLDMPDLQTEQDFENASYDLVQRMISKMLNDGEYIAPEPFMQLVDETDGGPGAIRLVQHAYLSAQLDEGVEEERLELLRRWLTTAQAMVSPPPAPAPANAAPPGPPGAAVPPPGGHPNIAPLQVAA